MTLQSLYLLFNAWGCVILYTDSMSDGFPMTYLTYFYSLYYGNAGVERHVSDTLLHLNSLKSEIYLNTVFTNTYQHLTIPTRDYRLTSQ